MALVKYGAGVVQMSGSIAGNVHARNRFGNYIRPRTKPVNPRSSRQMGARVTMMYLAEAWREDPMTDAKRLAWEVYAAGVNWLNKLGETVKLTGFNMFIRSNAARVRSGRPIIYDGPPDIGLPPGDPDFAITNLSAGNQNCDLAFDDTFDWCDEAWASLITFMGLPQSASRNFFNGPWRYMGNTGGSVLDPPTSPVIGVGQLPWTLVLGQKVWFEAHIYRADGRLSTKFRCDPAIVGA